METPCCQKTSHKPDDARTRHQGTPKYQGMNFVRQDFRLACYLRDGCACVWCGEGIEDGAKLTLDHLVPHSQGGSNQAENLITACIRCNSRRGARTLADFATAAASYGNHGLTAEKLLADVAAQTARPLAPFRVQAKALIASRGSAARALAEMLRK